MASEGGSRRDFLRRSAAVGAGAVGVWAAPTVSAVAEVEGSSGSVANSSLYCFLGFQRNESLASYDPYFYYLDAQGKPSQDPWYKVDSVGDDVPVPPSDVENGLYDGVVLSHCMTGRSAIVSDPVLGTTQRLSVGLSSDLNLPNDDVSVEYVYDLNTYTDPLAMTDQGYGTPGDLTVTAHNGYRIKHAYGWTPAPAGGGVWYSIPVTGGTMAKAEGLYTYAAEIILVPPATTP